MDSGRAFLGACTVIAVGAAVGLGFAVVPTPALASSTDNGGICVTFEQGSKTAMGWFEMTLDNDSGHAARIRDVHVQHVHDVTLSHLSIAPDTEERTPGLIGTDDPAVPEDFGRLVPVDTGYVVPAHGSVSVVGRIVLRDGAPSGYVDGIAVTTVGPLGTLATATKGGLRGVGIAQPGEGDSMECGSE